MTRRSIPALVAAALTAAAVPASAASLCQTGETVLFSCRMGAKQVSACDRGGGATYRFGRPGRIELQAGGGTYAQEGFSGGGETQIAFVNKGYGYVLYDKTVRTNFDSSGRHDPDTQDGLLVRRGAATVADHRCTGGAPGMSPEVSRLPAGTYVPH